MIILGIDSTGDEVSVGVSRDGDVSQEKAAGRPHSKELLPLIEKLLGTDRPDTIAVSIGPGSYTGTRVGVTTANMLGWIWSVPVFGITTEAAKDMATLLFQAEKEKRAGKISSAAFPIYTTTPGQS